MTWRLVRSEPTKETLAAMDAAYMPFGEMLAAYDAMLGAGSAPTEAEIDELCRAWADGSYAEWRVENDVLEKAPTSKGQAIRGLRDFDRARMRAFVSRLGAPHVR